MRIIAGRFKGMALSQFQADHIRPTTDRVKGSIFNKLQASWDGSTVLDLFSGTGNLGIEALSRGAKRVVCVENHPKSIEILKTNLNLLKIVDEIEVVRLDVLKFIEGFNGDPFDIILIDPPFTKKMGHSVMSALALSRLVLPSKEISRSGLGVVSIEYSKHESMEDNYGRLCRIDTKNFGDKLVAFFAQKGV